MSSYLHVSGLPCSHAMCAILARRLNYEDYVDEHFTKTVLITTYEHIIRPQPEKCEWPEDECEEMMPPAYKRGPGRPKHSRNKTKREKRKVQALLGLGVEPEDKVPAGGSIKCGTCSIRGHNSRSCPDIPSNNPCRKTMMRREAHARYILSQQGASSSGTAAETSAGPSQTQVNTGSSNTQTMKARQLRPRKVKHVASKN